jgi:hypothetical protein
MRSTPARSRGALKPRFDEKPFSSVAMPVFSLPGSPRMAMLSQRPPKLFWRETPPT